MQKQVTFTGMLSGQIKTSAIANADLFVLPTHSENFGIVVAESLAHEVPVITTKGAPWEDLIKYDCGWWIDNERNSLKNALIEAMNLSEDKRRQMGINGKIMVEKKYSWNFLSQKMSKVYSWILGTGNLPDCIEFSISR